MKPSHRLHFFHTILHTRVPSPFTTSVVTQRVSTLPTYRLGPPSTLDVSSPHHTLIKKTVIPRENILQSMHSFISDTTGSTRSPNGMDIVDVSESIKMGLKTHATRIYTGFVIFCRTRLQGWSLSWKDNVWSRRNTRVIDNARSMASEPRLNRLGMRRVWMSVAARRRRTKTHEVARVRWATTVGVGVGWTCEREREREIEKPRWGLRKRTSLKIYSRKTTS